MRHLTDSDIHDEIVEIRTYLADLPTPGECVGRRVAQARLELLEDEMVRRYEVEMYGLER